METSKSAIVKQAEVSANEGDPLAMEFLARRFFEGRGVVQSFQKSYYWSTIALSNGVTYLTTLNQFASKKLTKEQRVGIEADLSLIK
jgi:TPR repeat protein